MNNNEYDINGGQQVVNVCSVHVPCTYRCIKIHAREFGPLTMCKHIENYAQS